MKILKKNIFTIEKQLAQYVGSLQYCFLFLFIIIKKYQIKRDSLFFYVFIIVFLFDTFYYRLFT